MYRAAVLDGVRSFSGLATGGVRVCSVIACVTEDISTCGQRLPQYVRGRVATFEELSVIASVPTPVTVPDLQARDSAFFPVASNTSIMPLEPQDYTYSEVQQGNATVYTFTLANRRVELYSFSVWGRVFERDGGEASSALENSSVRPFGCTILVITLLSLLVDDVEDLFF